MTLKDLLHELEKAKGPSRQLDKRLAQLVAIDAIEGWRIDPYGCTDKPYFTQSIDAAVALCEQALPGLLCEVCNIGYATIWSVSPHPANRAQNGSYWEPRATPALALCTAIVKAKMEEANG